MTYTDLIDRITTVDVDEDFAAATRHPHECRCNLCRRWWALVGPEDGDDYGPFDASEIEPLR